MPLGKRTLALAFVLFVALLAPATASAARSVPQGFYGTIYSGNFQYVLTPSQQSAFWSLLSQGGAESVRVLFSWQDVQPKPPTALDQKLDWRTIDPVVYNATVRGMKILPILKYAPNWAKKFPNKQQSPPKSASDFANFVRLVIARYGPSGTFWIENPSVPKRPLTQYQIWDEPEISFHWYRNHKPWNQSDAKEYVALLRASYQAVHTTDPTAKVIMAALSIDSWKNLQKMYNWAPDLKGAFDIAALQGYSGTVDFVPTLVKRYRQVLNAHGAGSVPIYITEMTWPAAKGKAHPHYTTGYMAGFLTDQQGAARRLYKAYGLLRGKTFRTANKLIGVFWYTGVSAYSGTNEFEYSGLMTLAKGKPKIFPVYNCYKKSAFQAEGRGAVNVSCG